MAYNDDEAGDVCERSGYGGGGERELADVAQHHHRQHPHKVLRNGDQHHGYRYATHRSIILDEADGSVKKYHESDLRIQGISSLQLAKIREKSGAAAAMKGPSFPVTTVWKSLMKIKDHEAIGKKLRYRLIALLAGQGSSFSSVRIFLLFVGNMWAFYMQPFSSIDSSPVIGMGKMANIPVQSDLSKDSDAHLSGNDVSFTAIFLISENLLMMSQGKCAYRQTWI
nr:hypothetical protein Iba_chr02fCG6380 [Ipomoea batatas]